MESNTWKELVSRDGGRRFHSTPVEVIAKDARQRLEEISQDDIDDLFQIRIGSSARLWGIIDRNIMKILWWDPNHTVYPMNIKNN